MTNHNMPPQAALAWTGGKDSAMAFYEATIADYNITLLVTFVPTPPRQFKAHPLSMIKKQAQSLGITHVSLSIRENHAFEDYIHAINTLYHEYGISYLITGDIDLINQQPNWIKACCDKTEIEAHFPLWQQTRTNLLEKMLDIGLVFQFTYFNHPCLPKSWLYEIVDTSLMNKLRLLCDKEAIDLCGENGEYHTMVLDAPFFTAPIRPINILIPS